MPSVRTAASEDGLLRMSFMEHLEELRIRILKSLAGVGVAFGFISFCVVGGGVAVFFFDKKSSF